MAGSHEGQVVDDTGAGNGIGRAIAERFAGAGAHVAAGCGLCANGCGCVRHSFDHNSHIVVPKQLMPMVQLSLICGTGVARPQSAPQCTG